MNFRAYDIYEINDWDAEKSNADTACLFKELNLFPKVIEGSESYAPLNVHHFKEYILGILGQSYHTVLTKFEESTDTKDEIVLEDNQINDKVYFYIDILAMQVYVQGKLYPPTLSHKSTIQRLGKIFSQCLGKQIVLMRAQIDYTIEQIDEIFSTAFVKRIAFKNLEGLEVPEGALLHNPRKDLDDSLRETWNTYSKDNVDSMELKSKEGEKLSRNPLAKLGMLLSKENKDKDVFKSMAIIDDGERIDIKPTGNAHKIIYISKRIQEDPYETYDRILKKTSKDYRGRDDE